MDRHIVQAKPMSFALGQKLFLSSWLGWLRKGVSHNWQGRTTQGFHDAVYLLDPAKSDEDYQNLCFHHYKDLAKTKEKGQKGGKDWE
jgi:hypothetical protein